MLNGPLQVSVRKTPAPAWKLHLCWAPSWNQRYRERSGYGQGAGLGITILGDSPWEASQQCPLPWRGITLVTAAGTEALQDFYNHAKGSYSLKGVFLS